MPVSLDLAVTNVASLQVRVASSEVKVTSSLQDEMMSSRQKLIPKDKVVPHRRTVTFMHQKVNVLRDHCTMSERVKYQLTCTLPPPPPLRLSGLVGTYMLHLWTLTLQRIAMLSKWLLPITNQSNATFLLHTSH